MGTELSRARLQSIRTWTEMENPGLKVAVSYRLPYDEEWSTCSVDLGWGDPLCPAPKMIMLNATSAATLLNLRRLPADLPPTHEPPTHPLTSNPPAKQAGCRVPSCASRQLSAACAYE